MSDLVNNSNCGITVRTDALDQAMNEQARELDRELRGAWRAGYEVVHIYRDVSDFHFSIYAYPAMKTDDLPETDSDCLYQFFYDLTSPSDAEILKAIND